MVIAPGRGIKYIFENIYIDYSDIQEDILPYYPDFQDIQYISNKKEDIAIIPLPHYRINLIGIVNRIIKSFYKKRGSLYYHIQPSSQINTISPIKHNKSLIQKIHNLFAIQNFDISEASFEEMKSGIDQIICRVLQSPGDMIPIILQSHTKGYHGNFDSISKFFYYLTERYSEYLVTMTFTELLSYMDRITVRSNNKQ
jgi:hypothetical protein